MQASPNKNYSSYTFKEINFFVFIIKTLLLFLQHLYPQLITPFQKKPHPQQHIEGHLSIGKQNRLQKWYEKLLFRQIISKIMLNQSHNAFEVPLDEALLARDDTRELTGSEQRQIRFTYMSVCMGWITLVIFVVVSLWIPAQFTNVLGFLVSWMLMLNLWGYCSGGIGFFTFMNCLSIIIHLLLYWVSTLTSNYHFVLCGCGTNIILFTFFEMFVRHKIIFFKFYVYLYITYVLIVTYNQGIEPNWALMLTLDFYVLVAVIVAVRVGLKWPEFRRIGKFKFLMSVWFIFVALMLCLAGSFYHQIPWEYFSILPHVWFMGVSWYMCKNRHMLTHASKQAQQMLFYQISEVLLCDDSDYLHNPRQSVMGGKALQMCISCYSENSSLIYSQCKHACICKGCSLEWLKKTVKNCPLCRLPSPTLVEVQRKHDIVFRAVALYRFRD